MAKQVINIGTTANDGTGDPLRTAFDKVNSNFTELYNDDAGDVNSIIAGDGISVDTATGDVTITNTITNNNQLINGAGYVDGTGTANYIAKWTDGDTIGNSVIYDDGTNVGIGTSSPSNRLTVNSSTVNVGIKVISTDAGSTISFQDNTTNGDNVQVGAVADDMYFIAGGSERMRIDSSGRVGIGESNPQTGMHISLDTPIIRLENIDTTVLIDQELAGIEMYSNDASGLGVGIKTSIRAVSESATGSKFGLKFSTTDSTGSSDVERMRIDSAGAVLIGGQPKIDSATRLQVGSTDSGVNSIWSQADDIVFENNNDFGITIATPNTNYGTIAFADPESVNAGSIQYNHSDNSMAFGTNATERMRITSSGNVGIGESNPLVPLHISRDSASGTNYAMVLDNNNTTVNNEIGLLFRGSVGGINTDFEISSINTAANQAQLVFRSDGGAERMRINSNGNVEVNNAGGFLIIDTKNVAANPRLYFRNDLLNSTNFIEVDRGTNAMEFWNNGTERMRIDASGNTTIKTGQLNVDIGIIKSGLKRTITRSVVGTGGANIFATSFGDSTPQVGHLYVTESGTNKYLIATLFKQSISTNVVVTVIANNGITGLASNPGGTISVTGHTNAANVRMKATIEEC